MESPDRDQFSARKSSQGTSNKKRISKNANTNPDLAHLVLKTAPAVHSQPQPDQQILEKQMMSAESNAAYKMQMLEISEIMPDKSSDDNVDLGQLDFDENTIDGEHQNLHSQPQMQIPQYQERRRTFRLPQTDVKKG